MSARQKIEKNLTNRKQTIRHDAGERAFNSGTNIDIDIEALACEMLGEMLGVGLKRTVVGGEHRGKALFPLKQRQNEEAWHMIHKKAKKRKDST